MDKLTTEILKLSNSTGFSDAKQEWAFHYIFEKRNGKCLCGRNPIANVCVIKNRVNGFTTEIGNCCMKKVFGFEGGDKLFSAKRRLEQDVTKTLGYDVLDFIKERGVISDFEYKFYDDTMTKRILSEKQSDMRVRINNKYLDYVSGEEGTLFKIDSIINWNRNNKKLGANDFIRSLRTQYMRKGILSKDQMSALNKIHYKIFVEDDENA